MNTRRNFVSVLGGAGVLAVAPRSTAQTTSSPWQDKFSLALGTAATTSFHALAHKMKNRQPATGEFRSAADMATALFAHLDEIGASDALDAEMRRDGALTQPLTVAQVTDLKNSLPEFGEAGMARLLQTQDKTRPIALEAFNRLGLKKMNRAWANSLTALADRVEQRGGMVALDYRGPVFRPVVTMVEQWGWGGGGYYIPPDGGGPTSDACWYADTTVLYWTWVAFFAGPAGPIIGGLVLVAATVTYLVCS